MRKQENMKSVIVTGATGFVGQKLVTVMAERGIKVYAIYRRVNDFNETATNIIPVKCDVSNILSLKDMIVERGFDAFYHLAWDGGSGAAREDYLRQLNDVRYACDAARVAKILDCKRLIVTGTVTENIVKDSIRERYTSQNLMYAIAKDTTHKMVDCICRRESLDYCWARLSNVFGNGDNGSNLIAYTIREIKEGRIPEYGPCDQIYDFVYVDDVVEALINIGEHQIIEADYTISSGAPMLLRKYLEMVAMHMNGTIEIGKRKSDGIKYKMEWFNNELAKRDMVMKNIHSFKDALKML